MTRPASRLGIAIPSLLATVCMPALLAAGPYDDEPEQNGPFHDPVAVLQDKLDSKAQSLTYDDDFGYLKSVLDALEVPKSSQVLVFTKTSFQRNLIAPETPRAIYFGDDAYVGFVQGGDVLELASVDPERGTVFYTLPQRRTTQPKFVRQTHSCLQCHESGMTGGIPGHLMRSVYPDNRGMPILSAGTFVTTSQSPLADRWGGWYVTGTHGAQKHMGNAVASKPEEADELQKSPQGLNVTDLSRFFNTSLYLTPHSDITALMVAEHQTYLQNALAKAAGEAKRAVRDSEVLNKALNRPVDELTDSGRSRIQHTGDRLVRALLCCQEARLTDKITGTSDFAKEFESHGPRDRQGRSLRDLDLERRLFRYPCSYLIYSPAFDRLPEVLKEYVWQKLWSVLSGQDQSADFAHLSAEDRQGIVEILRETKPDLPAYWRQLP
ncbi:MAG TPA: hypothetical protein VHB77_20150 [Planctomycetaceae bacterium]|nr:hypothetical protein [Planctomycetaceae bacterium]